MKASLNAMNDASSLDSEGSGDKAGIGRESGKIPEDAARLAAAAEIAEQAATALVEKAGKRNDYLVLFGALSALVAEQARAGDVDAAVTAEQLSREADRRMPAGKSRWADIEPESARKKFSAAWKALNENYPELCANLEGRARQAGVRDRAMPIEKPGPDRRTKAYGFDLVPITDDADGVVPPKSQTAQSSANEITYLAELVRPIPWLGGRQFQFVLDGWRARILVAASALVPLFFVGPVWLLLTAITSEASSRSIIQASTALLVIGALFALGLFPYYQLLRDGIAKAPWYLSMDGDMLVLFRDRMKKGEPAVWRMALYGSTCPVCDDRIDVERGRGELRGRYVGVCRANRLEHVFTFDHVRCEGRRVRG